MSRGTSPEDSPNSRGQILQRPPRRILRRSPSYGRRSTLSRGTSPEDTPSLRRSCDRILARRPPLRSKSFGRRSTLSRGTSPEDTPSLRSRRHCRYQRYRTYSTSPLRGRGPSFPRLGNWKRQHIRLRDGEGNTNYPFRHYYANFFGRAPHQRRLMRSRSPIEHRRLRFLRRSPSVDECRLRRRTYHSPGRWIRHSPGR